MAVYKRLLFRNTIKGGQGNVSRLDNTTILDIVGDSCKTSSGKTVTISEAALIRKYDLQERPPAQTDHDYCDASNIVVLSEYKSAAISNCRLCCQHGRKEDHLQSVFKCTESS